MSVNDDDHHTRRHHLRAVEEPPFDPEYDQPTRQPAHNTPAEQALLGALLRTPQLADQLADTLDATDFYLPKHETIWRAIHAITATGQPADPAHLLEELQRTGDLTNIGGGPYLYDLVSAAPGTSTADQAHDYARIILDAARLRRAGEVVTRLSQVVRDARADTIDDALAQALDDLDAAAARVGASHAARPTTGLADLTWLLNGHGPPKVDPPAWGRRTCGNALFYAGRVNGVYGDPEAAKTWLTQVAVVEALHAGQPAAFVDVDHNGADHTAARLLLLGARLEQLADPHLFRYYEPDDADELRAAITDITAHRPAVAVLDSVGEMLPMLGVKSVDNDEITAAMRTLAAPPAAAGACVITVDHLPKSAEARATGFAIGGTAKKRAIDGAYIHAEARSQPAPGQVGRITLRIEKDRPGRLRETCTGKYVGTFTIDSTRPHTTVTTIGVEDSPITQSGVFRPTHLMEAVSRYVEEHDLCSGRKITEAIRGKATHVRAAIDRLIEEGYISPVAGPKNSTLHHAVAIYREAEDEQA